eukprot:CAMPEP_0202686388 /NCGR_PEP_ID=MMETSP1385-20130828/2192_1 /ASSEMBLY_ACC=CAM_ASM_000861 /TAXON_ID=933848 /ORGANISM="Elphidium margaritaceum" /LENGTH=218 /DNA_ID=CAMNT_0049340953 /DNA_START=72 /DNA_END=728 /DNA_ORIENTATION=+
MESDHSHEWEVLSEASSVHSFQALSARVHPSQDDDDNHSVHSLSSSASDISSAAIVHHASHAYEPSAFVPQIRENEPIEIIRAQQNELIPSYVDIEAELQRQRELVAQLTVQLNVTQNERNQIRSQRDELKERLNDNSIQISRLEQSNTAIDRQNSVLRRMNQLCHKQNGRKLRRKPESKSGASITNRRGHRPSVPAKLRFRRQRTTHRTVYCQKRSW